MSFLGLPVRPSAKISYSGNNSLRSQQPNYCCQRGRDNSERVNVVKTPKKRRNTKPRRQLEYRNRHVENVLENYDHVVAQRDEMRWRASEVIKRLDSVRAKQRDVFYELMCRNDELSREIDAENGRLAAAVVEDNDRLRRDNELLGERLDDRTADAHRLETERSTLSRHVQKLRNQLADANAMTTVLRDERRRAESRLRDRNRELVDLQKKLLEEVAGQTRLEQQVNAVQKLRAEYTELRGELREKSAERADQCRRVNEKRDELETLRGRTERLKSAKAELQHRYREEKTASDRIVFRLKDRVESATWELESADRRVCDARVEKTKLECWLKDAAETIRLLGRTKEQLEREVRKIESAAETLEQTIVAEQERHDAETKAAEAECAAADREIAELERSVQKQMATVRRLKTESHRAAQYSTANVTETGKRIPRVLSTVDDDDDDENRDDVGDRVARPSSQQPKPKSFDRNRSAESAFDSAGDFDCSYAKTAADDVAGRSDGVIAVGNKYECSTVLDEINDLWDEVTHCGKLYA